MEKLPTPNEIMNLLADLMLESDAKEFGSTICHGPGPEIVVEFQDPNDATKNLVEYRITIEKVKS